LQIRARQVDAGGVMAAGMQGDDRRGGCGSQGGAHSGEVDAAGLVVVVRIRGDAKARALEQRPVVLPARVTDQHRIEAADPLEEIGADLQRAGATKRLRRDQPARGDQRRVLAEQQFLHCGVVHGKAFDRQITAGEAGFHACPLGFAHGAQQWDAAVVVAIDAGTKTDLAGPRVGSKCLGQAQDRVPRRQFDGLKD
jgi:hypothetical protein